MLNNLTALLDSGAPAAVGDYESIQTVTVGAGGSATITLAVSLAPISIYKSVVLLEATKPRQVRAPYGFNLTQIQVLTILGIAFMVTAQPQQQEQELQRLGCLQV